MAACLVVATIGLAGSAYAAVPHRGALYGGGDLGPRPGRIQETALRVSRDGRALYFWANIYAYSPPPGAEARIRTGRVRIASDGSFRIRGPFADMGPLGRVVGTVEVRGRFISPDEAVGTQRARFSVTQPDQSATQWDSGAVPFRVNAPGLGLGSGLPRPRARFGGYTTQRSITGPRVNLPVLLRISADGRHISSMQFRFHAMCPGDTGLKYAFANSYMRAPNMLIRNRRFARRQVVIGQSPSGRRVVRYLEDVKGVFGPRIVSGTIRVTAQAIGPDGAVTGSCSVAFGWHATRRRPPG